MRTLDFERLWSLLLLLDGAKGIVGKMSLSAATPFLDGAVVNLVVDGALTEAALGGASPILTADLGRRLLMGPSDWARRSFSPEKPLESPRPPEPEELSFVLNLLRPRPWVEKRNVRQGLLQGVTELGLSHTA